MANLIQIRRDLAANWTSINSILAQGEFGFETDTTKLKIGNGTTAWTALPYVIDAGDYLSASSTNTLTNKTIDISSNTLTGVAGVTATQTLTNKTISGASNTITVDGTNAVGFRNIPQNSQSDAYTLVLDDAGKHIFHPSADTTARTFTIPANSSVAYPIGTAITFINQNGAGVVTIAITTDTMRLSPAGTTGSRTLAANGSATCVKVTATEWLISGSGLT